MFQYPYGDTQQLNLDWLMEQWQETKASIDGSLQGEIDRVEAAITDLLTARDQAVAAKTAAETAATSASGYAGTASTAASTATAQATAAAGSAALAGTHASNAQTSETNAGLQATAAGNSAAAAAVSAGNASNSEGAAAASSSAAAGNALYAEGMANGTQNGTPVASGSPYYENNAAYWAGEAQNYDNDAALAAYYSEAMAKGTMNGTPVTSGEPGYEDNAEYYKDQAAAQAAAAAASAASADGTNAQKMIAAPEEATSTASAAHAAGTYFRYNNKLYKATQDIALGGTITPNTNCVEDTVCAELTAQSEQIGELKNALIASDIIDPYNLSDCSWEQGSIKNNGTKGTSPTSIRTTAPIVVENGRLSFTFRKGNYTSIVLYLCVWKNGVFQGRTPYSVGSYTLLYTDKVEIVFTVQPGYNSSDEISASDGNTLVSGNYENYLDISDAIDKAFIIDKRIRPAWQRGKISDSGTNSASTSTTYMRTKYKYKIPTSKFKLTVPSGINAVVFTYSQIYGVNFLSKLGTYTGTSEIYVTSGTYIRIMASYANGSDIALSVGDTIIISYESTVDDFIDGTNAKQLEDYSSLAMFQTMAVIGDSWASGSLHFPDETYQRNYELSWIQILARKIGATATNFSEGGLSTKGWLENADHGLTALLAAEPVELYFIDLGINDNTQIAAGTLTLGTVDDIDTSDYTQNPDTFFGDYGRIIGNIKEHAPNAIIVLLSVPRPDERNMDEYIAQIAEKYELPFILLTNDEYFTSGYFYETVNDGHLTAVGYSGMANAIQRLTQKYIAVNHKYFDYFKGTV